MPRSLTSADAVIMLAVPGIFSTPQQLQGFSTDNVFEVGNRVLTETAMGVDGYMSAGMVFSSIDQTFTLQADSLSNDFFDTWAATTLQQKAVFRVSGTVELPAVEKSFVCVNGALIDPPPMPSAGKILQPRKFLIRWQSITANPI